MTKHTKCGPLCTCWSVFAIRLNRIEKRIQLSKEQLDLPDFTDSKVDWRSYFHEPLEYLQMHDYIIYSYFRIHNNLMILNTCMLPLSGLPTLL